MSSTITPSSYYSLPTSTDSGASAQASDTSSLLQALTQAEDSSSQDSSSSLADTVDLSPQAQSIMSALGIGTGASASADSASTTTGSGFLLSPQQEQQISSILANYQNAPFTQDTFNQIQNDLESAGLGSDQLAAQNAAQSFNPTTLMLDAMDGIQDSIVTPNGATEQTNASSYMQQIFSQWQSMSTTAGADGTDTSGGTGSTSLTA